MNVVDTTFIQQLDREHRIAMCLQDIKRGLQQLDIETRDREGRRLLGERSNFADISAIALAGRVLYGRVREDE